MDMILNLYISDLTAEHGSATADCRNLSVIQRKGNIVDGSGFIKHLI